MTPVTPIAVLLVVAATIGSARWTLRWMRRPESRPARWHMAALLVLQLAATFLLFRVLVPPERVQSDSALVVMTAGADGAGTPPPGRGAVVVALPEADRDAAARAGAARVPDLATALRAHPGTTRLVVLGHGLEPRDIAPARGLAIGFEPAPLPRGFVGLQSTGRAVVGGRLHVAGHVQGVDGARVELLDPSGALQDRAEPNADGRFRLAGPVRAAGPALWRLRLTAPGASTAAGGAGDVAHAADPGGADPGGRGDARAVARVPVEEVDLPVDARPGSAPRVLLLAGAPGPEVKYLRRWAVDAGLHLHSRMALGGGVMLGDGPVVLDAESLAGFDLAIVDERAWAGLDAGARRDLLTAIEGGLGLLFRVTNVPDATTRQALRQLGFAAMPEKGTAPRDVRLVGTPGPGPGDDGDRAAIRRLPVLARQPATLAAEDSVPMLHDAEGVPLARWRALGRGRVAAWNLDQTFRLVLAGHADRHALLWSEAVGALARADAPTAVRMPGQARVGTRATLCELPDGTVVVAPDGTRFHPQRDPAADGCAAIWPRRAGWYRIGDGDGAGHLYVREADALPGVLAMQRLEAMRELQAGTPPAPPRRAAAAEPGPRWPWFLGWLAATALLWWLERRRGRPAATPSVADVPADRVSSAAAPRGSPPGG